MGTSADFLLAQQFMQGIDAADGLSVELYDNVALAQAGASARPIGLDVHHQQTRVGFQVIVPD